MASRKGKIKNTKSITKTVMKELSRINRQADVQGCSGLGKKKNPRR